jgi:hypothetical protein
MEITGRIEHIGQTQQVSDKFSKRLLVLETRKDDADRYPQLIPVELTQGACSVLDDYTVGDMVTAGINLRGRKWTDASGTAKYFGSIQCWRLAKSGQQAAQPDSPEEPPAWERPSEDEIPF